MSIAEQNQYLQQQFSNTPIIPVINVNNLDDTKRQVDTLVARGCTNLELTLRTPLGLQAIEMLAKTSGIRVGAGTVTNYQECLDAYQSGATFIVSPGINEAILKGVEETQVAFLGGVSTLSEAMRLSEFGCQFMKFFPAETNGGIKTLKAWSGPMPNLRFCPTGGVNTSNYQDYLELSNVICVGSSQPLELL